MLKQEDYENLQEQIRIQQEIPGVRETAEVPAQSEHYGDFIVKYMQNIYDREETIPGIRFQAINDLFGVLYIPLDMLSGIEVNSYSYGSLPKCYTYMDLESLSASGITRLHNHPYLQLRGKGTAVAIVDSGIDYRNPVFRNEAGSRIEFLWDQTLEGGPDQPVPYGRLFRKEEIDRALAAEDPLEIVPSVDTNGHGTMLAAAAAGNLVLQENFSGAAPESSLIVVKVKPAKEYLRQFYLFPPDADLFQEDDIMLGMAFAMRFAREMGMPLSFCLGIGTSQGAHIGWNPLSQYVDYVASFSQISVLSLIHI